MPNVGIAIAVGLGAWALTRAGTTNASDDSVKTEGVRKPVTPAAASIPTSAADDSKSSTEVAGATSGADGFGMVDKVAGDTAECTPGTAACETPTETVEPDSTMVKKVESIAEASGQESTAESDPAEVSVLSAEPAESETDYDNVFGEEDISPEQPINDTTLTSRTLLNATSAGIGILF